MIDVKLSMKAFGDEVYFWEYYKKSSHIRARAIPQPDGFRVYVYQNDGRTTNKFDPEGDPFVAPSLEGFVPLPHSAQTVADCAQIVSKYCKEAYRSDYYIFNEDLSYWEHMREQQLVRCGLLRRLIVQCREMLALEEDAAARAELYKDMAGFELDLVGAESALADYDETHERDGGPEMVSMPKPGPGREFIEHDLLVKWNQYLAMHYKLNEVVNQKEHGGVNNSINSNSNSNSNLNSNY